MPPELKHMKEKIVIRSFEKITNFLVQKRKWSLVKEQLSSELHPPSTILPKSTQNSDNFPKSMLFAWKENYLKELSKR